MRLGNQRGTGLIEVMIALVVLMFAVLSISNLQTTSLVSLEISKAHFGVNEQTQEMLEVLRVNVTNARNGAYNLDYEDTLLVDTTTASPATTTIAQWKRRVSEQLPDGAGKIECEVSKCTVSVRWTEYIDGSNAYQYFRMAGPI
ncbi:MAG: hypothetical protein AB8B79_16190 [Granulosicoccus sp.]